MSASLSHTLPDGTVLRPLSRERGELETCVALQRAVWGEGFADVVSTHILRIAQALSGVATGAFAPGGAMLGFVFGITGLEEGRPLHWSHMLAVLPEARGRDLGYHLKRFQRRRLLDLGVDRVRWTYDPLVSKNAHLNLARLGARAVEYHRDYYGSGEDSALSVGIGTDRLVVEWRLRDPAVEALVDGGGRPPEAGREVVRAPIADLGTAGELPDSSPARIEIPFDIHRVRREDPEAAAGWRAATRHAFEILLDRGFEVSGFYREEPPGERSFYVLRKAAT